MHPYAPLLTARDNPPPVLSARRHFLRCTGLAAAAASLLRRGPLIAALMQGAHAAAPDIVNDCLNGLLAFVVPGPDAYSVAQGAYTREPGWRKRRRY